MATLPSSLELITAPTLEPVTIDEVNRYGVRVDDIEDDVVANAIVMARQRIEHDARIAVMTQTWDLKLNRFPNGPEIEIPNPPLATVTTVKYLDTSGSEQTFSSLDYEVDGNRAPGVVRLANGSSWPSIQDQQDAVRIRYVAGYSTTALVPELVKHTIKQLAHTSLEFRELAIVGTTAAQLPFASYDTLISSIGHGSYP